MLGKLRVNKSKIIVVIFFVLVGVWALTISHASAPTVQIEPENGSLSAEVQKVSSDPSASGNSYVKFKNAPSPLTFSATDDTYVLQGTPYDTCTFGGVTVCPYHNGDLNLNRFNELRANLAMHTCDVNGQNPGTGTNLCAGHHDRQIYLKFKVSGLNFTPSSVDLKLYAFSKPTVTDCHFSSHQIYTPHLAVNNLWSESTLTWNNKPDLSTTDAGPAYQVPSTPIDNTYITMPLNKSTVTADGDVTVVLTNSWTCFGLFATKEAFSAPTRPPLLVINP